MQHWGDLIDHFCDAVALLPQAQSPSSAGIPNHPSAHTISNMLVLPPNPSTKALSLRLSILTLTRALDHQVKATLNSAAGNAGLIGWSLHWFSQASYPPFLDILTH
jgi:hypothetical protein